MDEIIPETFSYICVFVCQRSPDQTKNDRDLKFSTHTPCEHTYFLFYSQNRFCSFVDFRRNKYQKTVPVLPTWVPVGLWPAPYNFPFDKQMNFQKKKVFLLNYIINP